MLDRDHNPLLHPLVLSADSKRNYWFYYIFLKIWEAFSGFRQTGFWRSVDTWFAFAGLLASVVIGCLLYALAFLLDGIFGLVFLVSDAPKRFFGKRKEVPYWGTFRMFHDALDDYFMDFFY